MNQPFVSVIIPVYNDSNRLEIALQSLYLQTYPYSKYEIIVVDNASDDSEREKVKIIVNKFPNTKLLYEPKRGCCAARNRGITAANGEVFAFTDADCIPTLNWIAAGVQAFLEHPNIGLVAGHIRFFFKGDRPTVAEYVDSIFYLRQKDYVRHHYGATANVFTSRKVLETVGLFNDQLPALGDKEWGQRVFKAGYKVIYSPYAVVRHPARNRKQLMAKVQRCAVGNWVIYQKLTWKEFWGLVSPINPTEYRKVIEDSNLKGFKEKLTFILTVNQLKYTTAFTIIRCWLSYQLSKSST